MVSDFFLCLLLFVLITYIPGIIVLRSLKLDAITAISFAPVPCIALYALIPVIYHLVDIKCTWTNIVIPSLAICLISWIATTAYTRLHFISRTSNYNKKYEWITLVLYLITGITTCFLIFVLNLNGVNAFDAKHDNITHYNTIRSFIDSGIWSSTAISSYNATGLEIAPLQNTTFYPSAWHSLVSIIVSILGCEITIAVNAVNAAIIGIVFPLSVYAFLRKLFPNELLIWIAGAFVSLAFTAFPWALLIKGPLYSNILAYSILPSIFSLVITLFNENKSIHSPHKALSVLIIGLISFLALGFSQPNSIFVLLLFCFFYFGPILKKKIQSALREKTYSQLFNSFGFYIIYSSCAILIWIFLTMLPLPSLDYVVHYENIGDINLTPSSSAFSTLSFAFFLTPPQWTLVVVASIGSIFLFIRKRGWIIWLAAYMLFLYFISRFMLGFPKILITGIWYNDPWRLAACATLFLIPIVCVGIAVIINGLSICLSKIECSFFKNKSSSKEQAIKSAQRICTIGVLLIFSIVNYYPNYQEVGYSNINHVTSFGYLEQRIAQAYGKNAEQVYSKEEREFVQKALEVIPKNAVVINQPNDGSVFAYGLDGMNTYFRSIILEGLNDRATTIRAKLNQINSNDKVAEAVDSMHGSYVLLLDQDKSLSEGSYLHEYTEGKRQKWRGINNINDDTPGFEVVLAENDMRLYKIL